MEQLLTASEVAHMLRVSTMTIYRLLRAGELRAVRIGRSYRFRESDILAYLAGSPGASAPPKTDPRAEASGS